jgi:hypothetical protein
LPLCQLRSSQRLLCRQAVPVLACHRLKLIDTLPELSLEVLEIFEVRGRRNFVVIALSLFGRTTSLTLWQLSFPDFLSTLRNESFALFVDHWLERCLSVADCHPLDDQVLEQEVFPVVIKTDEPPLHSSHIFLTHTKDRALGLIVQHAFFRREEPNSGCPVGSFVVSVISART